jgi:putative transposase
MVRLSRAIQHLVSCVVMLCTLLLGAARFLRCCLRSPAALAAENLFLRKQLALYQERHVKPRHATNAIRVALVWLSQWFDWQPALAVVEPKTFQRWRRQGCQLFWRDTSCPGRPAIPVELQRLIQQMARDNLTWGQRRMANELRLKLGLQVSPRTVRKYMPTHGDRAPGHRVPSQRWRTFVRNHAWDLIVRDVSMDVIRGVQALLMRLLQFPQRWWRHAVSSAVRGTPQSHAVAMPLLRATVS